MTPDDLLEVAPSLRHVVVAVREHLRLIDDHGEPTNEDRAAKTLDYAADLLVAWVAVADRHPFYVESR